MKNVLCRDVDECEYWCTSSLLQSLHDVLCFLYLATNWASGEDDHVVARAEFDFSAASEEEISLRTGDMINLAPKGESSQMTGGHFCPHLSLL